MTEPILEFDDLRLAYLVRGQAREVLRGVSFSIKPGEAYGLVGESGCGKSTAAYAAVRSLPRNARVLSGGVRLDGRDVLTLTKTELRQLRANTVSMVYQDPAQALNPTIRIGLQLIESFTVMGIDRSTAEKLARSTLDKVQISDPSSVMNRFAHQLSGGMQQRVVIAMALACDPKLLILDEPTTGLDVTVEAEVLELIRNIRHEYGTSVLFISHNLAVVRSICDRVGVLYSGKLVEEGIAHEVFDTPMHPYTVGLLQCLPAHGLRKDSQRLATIPGFLPQLGASLPTCVFVDRCSIADDKCRMIAPEWRTSGQSSVRCHHIDKVSNASPTQMFKNSLVEINRSGQPILELRNISKTFHQGSISFKAINDISLSLYAGETIGLVGESGSGKTTLAHTILGLHAPDTGGNIYCDGVELLPGKRRRTLEQIRSVQIVFQNPDSALNRRRSVRKIVSRTLKHLAKISSEAIEERLLSVTSAVRLTEGHLDMRPGQLSGGLKQRVAIARAYAGQPRVLVLDEPTSSLDVSVQAAILNLLADLQRKNNTSYIFISHDLRVIRYLANRIAVLYLGRIMEVGPAERVFDGPHHPYTEALLSAVTTTNGNDKERIRLQGEIPSSILPPSGCVFHSRCPRRLEGDICSTVEPPLTATPDGGVMRCHIPFDQLGFK